MRLTSITLSVMCALLLSACAQNASAENSPKHSQKSAPDFAGQGSLYIEMINENEVIIENKTLTLDELEDFLIEAQSDQPERMTILYITDTQFVNQAYRLAFDLKRVIQKHIYVTYRPS